MDAWNPTLLLPALVDHLDAGVFVVDRDHNVVLWNKFMINHTHKGAEIVIGKSLFESFPELPRKWLEKKLSSVAALKNYAFTSWEQRPWLFQFSHNRPITGGIDYMRQNCVFMPMSHHGGDAVEFISVIIFDVTDTAIYQRQLSDALIKLEESSITDGLTRIFNRRHLSERLATEFSRVSRVNGVFSLIMFDLDHFKKINDHYGHLGGDEVLREVARRVKPLLRAQDIFGRYGGEEFCIALPDANLESCAAVAERIRAQICAEPVPFGEHRITMSASLGITCFEPNLPNFEAMLQAADDALYEAKHRGRNQVCSKADITAAGSCQTQSEDQSSPDISPSIPSS